MLLLLAKTNGLLMSIIAAIYQTSPTCKRCSVPDMVLLLLTKLVIIACPTGDKTRLQIVRSFVLGHNLHRLSDIYTHGCCARSPGSPTPLLPVNCAVPMLRKGFSSEEHVRMNLYAQESGKTSPHSHIVEGDRSKVERQYP